MGLVRIKVHFLTLLIEHLFEEFRKCRSQVAVVVFFLVVLAKPTDLLHFYFPFFLPIGFCAIILLYISQPTILFYSSSAYFYSLIVPEIEFYIHWNCNCCIFVFDA